MKKENLLQVLLMVLTVGNLSAHQLTPDQALRRLQASAHVTRAASAAQYQLVYTASTQSINTYYAYNKTDGGYVLLAADDCMPALLGYADKGSFDYDRLPSNMQWYLSLMESKIEKAITHGRKVTRISGNEVAPLLGATQWDQNNPFNLEVPVYEYGENGKEQAPVGCVACATAQIMRYHKHPSVGIGGETSYKFMWDTKEGQDKQVATEYTEFSTNFSEHTYDWANMLDKYDASNPNWNEAQGKAVSVLLKDIGVASKMRYGTQAAGGSGTQTYEAMKGLVNHFGYDAYMQFIVHKFYTDDEWDNIIYSELASSRPVMLGGNGADGSGGHEFVCDGFKDGMFHINWGWSGQCDGYFQMTGPGMIPDGSGSGGAGDGASYGYDLEAAIGIRPSEGGSVFGTMATTGYTCKVNDRTLTLTGLFYNLCYVERTDTLGIMLQASDGTPYNFVYALSNLETNSYCESIETTFDEGAVPDGEYTVKPIFRGPGDNSWSEIYVLSTFKAATIKFNGGAITVTNNDVPKITAEGALTTNKKSFRPTKKNDDGTLDAEELILTCEAGIKNCDEKGQKLSFGCEFYDLTESNDSVDVYWLSNYAATDAEELAPGASITTITVEILPELEAGHSYEVNPIFYLSVDESLDDDAYWDALDKQAQYVDLGQNDPPVIDIVSEITAIAKTEIISAESVVYDVYGVVVSAKTVYDLPAGIYLVKDARGVRKIVKK